MRGEECNILGVFKAIGFALHIDSYDLRYTVHKRLTDMGLPLDWGFAGCNLESYVDGDRAMCEMVIKFIGEGLDEYFEGIKIVLCRYTKSVSIYHKLYLYTIRMIGDKDRTTATDIIYNPSADEMDRVFC